MATWLQENAVLTDAGLSMLSKAQVGLGKLCITKVVTRDVWDTVANNRKLTGDSSTVTNIKQEAVLLTPPGEGDAETTDGQNVGVSKIVARFSNERITEKYHIKQVVVFMKLIDLDPNAPEGTDIGEVPYMVAQTESSDDSDIMPTFSDNPTAINYDLYILHSGVAQIDIAVKTAGYVDDDTFNEFKKYVISILNEGVGQNTKDLNFDVWTPIYTEDTDPSGGRHWSKKVDDAGEIVTTEKSGQKSAERFNMYAENNNIAVGSNCHVEGNGNVSLAADSHIEGVENHSGFENTWGVHMEGRRNYATIGWFQHIEGECNQSAGYVTHVEGNQNKAINSEIESVGNLHIEGSWNTVDNGRLHHVEGSNNTVKQGYAHHIQGIYNTIEKGNCHSISGSHNTISGNNDCNDVSGYLNVVTDCGEATVSGRENKVINSNQSSVSGYLNTVTNSERAIVSGIRNTITNSRGTSVSGDSNKAIENCFETSVSGYTNTVTRSKHASISGTNNNVTDSENSLICGSSNTVSKESSNCVVTGVGNTVTNTLSTYTWGLLVGGDSNNITDASDSVISGIGNTVSRSSSNLISGTSNTVLLDNSFPDLDVNTCVISGAENSVQKTRRTLVTGHSNTVTNYQANPRRSEHNVISGEVNDIKGLFSSVATGFKNSITNIHDSFIGGRENKVSSEVSESGWNAVTCVGYKCEVVNSQAPQFATGTSNVIKGSNSAVFGSNNLATSNDQVVMGHYNVEDTNNKFAFVIGGGSKNGENVARKNILELDWDGNLHISALYTSDIYNKDGESQLNAWNISDGTGQGSLVGNNTASNHATDLYSSAFGNSTEATNKYSFATGNTTKAHGMSSVSMGDTCESIADYTFSTGIGCKAKSGASQSMGYFNSIDTNSYSACATGYENIVEAAFASFTSGSNNTNKSKCSNVSGESNSVSGEDNIVSGKNNTVSTSNNLVVSGNTNKVTSTNNSIISGHNGEVSESDSLFSIGSNYVNKAINSISLGTNNKLLGSKPTNGITNSIVVGDSNNVYCSNTIIAGESNYVAGSRNLVVGFQNRLGMHSDSGSIQENYGISCIVSGNNNYSVGKFNSIQGSGLRDYSMTSGNDSDYPTLANLPSGIANSATFVGSYNNTSKTVIDRDLFTVGIGGTPTSRENGFSVAKDGNIYAKGTLHTGNADIAEWFEWEDKNLSNEDRRGLFVTLKGDKIVLADADTKYLFGIVSACPAIAGNSYEDSWNEKYLKDVFGEIIYEDYVIPAETTTIINKDGEEEEIVVRPERTAKRPVLNPDYDATQEYIPRSERPEWSYVSSKGRLVMVDDGTCVVDSYCKPMSGGIATASNTVTAFRVLKRIDKTHILVWADGVTVLD